MSIKSFNTEWIPVTEFKLEDFKKGDIIKLSNNGIHFEFKAKVVSSCLIDFYGCKVDVNNYNFFLKA